MERIEGRTAFITGGASGIGLAIAESLLAAGARVVLADWNAEALEREAGRLGAGALGCRLDVRDRDGWQAAKRAAEEAFGPVGILVSNAGVAPGRYVLADMPPEHFDKLIAIMLTGAFNGVRTFAGGMRDRGEGHIVNTASMAGLVPGPRIGAYTAAKFALVGLSEALRAELAPRGVGVSVLCPGLVRTNLGASDRSAGQPASGRSPLDDGLDPRVVAEQVLSAIRADELYVITHGEYGPAVAERAARLQRAFDAAPRRAAPIR